MEEFEKNIFVMLQCELFESIGRWRQLSAGELTAMRLHARKLAIAAICAKWGSRFFIGKGSPGSPVKVKEFTVPAKYSKAVDEAMRAAATRPGNGLSNSDRRNLGVR